MRSDWLGLRRAIWVAVGVVACGPTRENGEAGGDGDGDGDGDASGATVGSEASGEAGGSGEAGSAETGASTVATSASGTGDDSGGGPLWCGVPVPPGAMPPACDDPIVILQPSENGDVPTGLEQCADGRLHRTSAVACEYPASVVGTCNGQGVPTDVCAVDADCADAPHGYCNLIGGFASYCDCQYGCESDADCGDGQLCLCDGAQSRCVTADCTTDADCEGWACVRGSTPSACGTPPAFFACQGPLDTCDAAAGCDPSSCTACLYSADECAWACRPHDEACADCGRPYLVGGEARTALATRRADWLAEIPPLQRPDAATCAALAEHWRRCARMEHASVAAFARYCLDLLALGAPPALLAGAQQAMADEIEHARLCFALASSYAGAPCGPGPLPSEGALADRDPRRILADLVLEGCIGETVAAAEAIESLAHARDPVVRGVLETIAADELRHASLAWQHVRWALADATASERRELVGILRQTVAEAIEQRHADAPHGADLRAHGVLGSRQREAVRRRVLAEIVVPCTDALASRARIGAQLCA